MKLKDFITWIPDYTRVKISKNAKNLITYGEALRKEWHGFNFDQLIVRQSYFDIVDDIPTVVIIC